LNARFDPARLLQTLHDARVDYVIIGGFAVIAYGVIRTTQDLDICPDPALANLERLASVNRQLHAENLGTGDIRPEEFPFDPTDADQLAEGGNFRMQTDLGVLDVMQWVPGIASEPAYSTLAPASVEAQIEQVPVRVCALEHLRLMKRTAGRPQDLQDLEDLAAAQPARGDLA